MFLRHPLPDTSRLENRDAVADDDGTGRLVRRVIQRWAQMMDLRLQAADDGVPTPNVDESRTIDVERSGCQGLLPGAFRLRLTRGIHPPPDGVAALLHDDRGRARPPLHGKCNDRATT